MSSTHSPEFLAENTKTRSVPDARNGPNGKLSLRLARPKTRKKAAKIAARKKETTRASTTAPTLIQPVYVDVNPTRNDQAHRQDPSGKDNSPIFNEHRNHNENCQKDDGDSNGLVIRPIPILRLRKRSHVDTGCPRPNCRGNESGAHSRKRTECNSYHIHIVSPSALRTPDSKADEPLV